MEHADRVGRFQDHVVRGYVLLAGPANVGLAPEGLTVSGPCRSTTYAIRCIFAKMSALLVEIHLVLLSLTTFWDRIARPLPLD